MVYLVDTGVLLRAVDRRDGQHSDVVAALTKLYAENHELATSTQNLREFWNVSTRPSTARGGYGRTIEGTLGWLRTMHTVLRVLCETTATYVHWMDLLERHRVTGIQVHDAQLVAIMQSHSVTRILTLNPSDFRRFPDIEVLTSAEILARD
jgi:predicted nucleic acid-binding protein